MEIKRFFASQSCLNDAIITISGDEFVHLSKVLRYKVGYKIIVSLEDGKDYYCTISNIFKESCEAVVDDIKENECVTDAQITLFQALPKGDKIDLIIQKCVELGVKNIIPFKSKFVNEKKFNTQRANKVALEACKQCGRSIKCMVCEVIEFDKVVQIINEFDLVILCYENATCGKISDIPQLKKAKRIAIIIGSEGGFAKEEIREIREKNAVVISLGKRILRCETAAIVTTALVSYELGDLGESVCETTSKETLNSLQNTLSDQT